MNDEGGPLRVHKDQHCDDKVRFLFYRKWCPLLKFDPSRLSQYHNDIFVAHLQFQLDIRASGKRVHHFSAFWRAVSWIIEDGYVPMRLKLPSYPGLSFLPPKFNLRFGFPATALASLEYLEHFISYLELRIHCPVYYIPPTHLSHLRSLTMPSVTGLSRMMTFLSRTYCSSPLSLTSLVRGP